MDAHGKPASILGNLVVITWTGIEPVIFSLPNRYSTSELLCTIIPNADYVLRKPLFQSYVVTNLV